MLIASSSDHATADAATTFSSVVRKVYCNLFKNSAILEEDLIIGPLSFISPHSSIIHAAFSHGEHRNPRVSPGSVSFEILGFWSSAKALTFQDNAP